MHQGSYKHTLEDIQARTGLSSHFINRCSSKISDLLDPFRQYGDNNRLFYDDNGLMVFDYIGQLKREGKTIPEIRAALEQQLQDRVQSGRKTPQSRLQNSDAEEGRGEAPPAGDQAQLLSALRDAYQQLGVAKDDVIAAKDETISSLRQNLQLLTDGRDPETVRQEHERNRKRAAEQEQELKRLRREQEHRAAETRRRRQKRRQLLDELQALKGKWFTGDKRAQFLRELAALDEGEGKPAPPTE